MRRSDWLIKITRAGVIAAVYCVLTFALAPVSFGPFQFRAAEAMAVLPMIFPEATAGLFVGCILSNLLSSYGVLDVVIGSLATLCAALLTARAKKLWLAPVPPVIINAVAVGFAITFAQAGMDISSFPIGVYLMNAGSLFISEAVVCFGLGIPLLIGVKKYMTRKNNT
ncbi:MAG TPA: QueT transporter family protein [Bacillota bacterium]|nr:QueT transporter family protein [Bacillota bacterium]